MSFIYMTSHAGMIAVDMHLADMCKDSVIIFSNSEIKTVQTKLERALSSSDVWWS